jgi:hypothetical protein
VRYDTGGFKVVWAMLNSLGGLAVFGAGDKGELIGQDMGQSKDEMAPCMTFPPFTPP